MALLFRDRDDALKVTDQWIQSSTAGNIPIRDVRQVWVARRGGAASRLMSALLGAGVLLVIIGGVGATGWLTRNWIWLLAAPVLFMIAVHFGLLDLLAIYFEKRHHELWVATGSVAMPIYRANSVEARKAQRAIERASERHFESL
jgi:hypothetical protein